VNLFNVETERRNNSLAKYSLLEYKTYVHIGLVLSRSVVHEPYRKTFPVTNGKVLRSTVDRIQTMQNTIMDYLKIEYIIAIITIIIIDQVGIAVTL
jgi:hypothetical protein